MAVEIRHLEFDELTAWIRAMRITYLMDPGTPITDATIQWWRRVFDPERTWGAFEDERCVATLRTFGAQLSVPSGPDSECASIPADALTQVTVSATHRRRGLLSSILMRSLSDARDRGEYVSILRAAEWPIYGRFGYAVASQVTNYTVRTVPRPEILPPRRRVTIAGCEPADLAGPAASVLAARISRQPGQLNRQRSFWERLLGLEGLTPTTRKEPVCVLARDEAGQPVGYAIWTPKEGDWFDDRVDIVLHELIANTTDAYRALWAYLIGLDLVKSIGWAEQAIDEPLEWLLSDGRAARRGLTIDGLWLRMLNVEGALSARRYGTADQLTLEVTDTDAGGWAAGRYLLDAGPEHAECRATASSSPDLTVSQRALAALYLGGRSVRSLAESDLIDEHTAGAARRLARMFDTNDRAPWNASPF